MVRRGWPGILVALGVLLHGGGLRGGDGVVGPAGVVEAPAAPVPAGPLPLVLPLLSPPPEWIPPSNPWSNAGFVDPALPWDIVRLRFDSLYDVNRPTRGQFLFAPMGAPRFKGLPFFERRIDYQESSLYVEHAFYYNVSAFIDLPVRAVNPEVNDNHFGLTDMHAGVKLAFVQTHDFLATFQFRVQAPTGAASRGLGNGAVELEPGLLLNWQAMPGLLVEGEVIAHFPVNDSRPWGSEVIQYGLAVSYGDRPSDGLWAVPVGELMGWSLTRGADFVPLTPRRFGFIGTGGDTIVNGFLGVRAGYGCLADLYVGYGRALTGNTWYSNGFRLELRYHF